MQSSQQVKIDSTLALLLKDAKNDYIKMTKGMVKSIFRPLRPSDVKDVYLSITEEQGKDLKRLIIKNNLRNVVEFGTSFGISTLFLAQGIVETHGKITTTELIESKAQKAIANFEQAGVSEYIEVRIGDALKTLENYHEPIDLLVLDGWKNLYLSIFQMLEPYFSANTFIYVDNANMTETQIFLKHVSKNPKYILQSQHCGKVVLITIAD